MGLLATKNITAEIHWGYLMEKLVIWALENILLELRKLSHYESQKEITPESPGSSTFPFPYGPS